jgi:hypothetical protein
MHPEIRPFRTFPIEIPQIVENPKKTRANISAGPNFKANLATMGATIINVTMLRTPAKIELTRAVPRTFPAIPLLDRG